MSSTMSTWSSDWLEVWSDPGVEVVVVLVVVTVVVVVVEAVGKIAGPKFLVISQLKNKENFFKSYDHSHNPTYNKTTSTSTPV